MLLQGGIAYAFPSCRTRKKGVGEEGDRACAHKRSEVVGSRGGAHEISKTADEFSKRDKPLLGDVKDRFSPSKFLLHRLVQRFFVGSEGQYDLVTPLLQHLIDQLHQLKIERILPCRSIIHAVSRDA